MHQEQLKFTSLEEALKNPKDVTELSLDKKECKKEFPASINELINLKKLAIIPKTMEWFKLPLEFKELPIESITIQGMRINEILGMKHLKELRVDGIAGIDILPLCKNFPDLEVLEIWMGGINHDIPPEIGNLKKLTKLIIAHAGFDVLPDEIEKLQELRFLQLSKLDIKRLPAALSKLRNLEELDLNDLPNIMDIPEETGDLKKLKILRLSDIFTGKRIDHYGDEWFDNLLDRESNRKEMRLPRAIGRMSALEELILYFTPITHLNPLKSLKKLKTLKLVSTGVRDIDALEDMENLEELDIHDHDIDDSITLGTLSSLKRLNIGETHIRDLSPLAHLKKLEYLKIYGCSCDKHGPQVTAKALRPLFGLQKLKEVIAQNFSSKDWENRKEIPEPLEPEDVLRRLKSNDADEAAYAIKNMTDIFATFGAEKNTCDKGKPVAIEILDNALEKFVTVLDIETLTHVVKETFGSKNLSDNFKATVTATEEIIRRRSAAGENKVVDIFINGTTYYDSGHRTLDGTVYDLFIEELFPQFETEPLGRLLLWCDNGFLDSEYGDAMEDLFIPFFEKIQEDELDEELLANVLDHFKEYCLEGLSEYGGTEDLLESIEDLELTGKTKTVVDKTLNSYYLSKEKDQEEIEIKKETGDPEHEEIKAFLKSAFTCRDAQLFIEASKKAVASPRAKELSLTLANYTTKLLIAFLQGGDFTTAKRLVLNFVSIFPSIDRTPKMTDLASNSLVLAILSQDPDIEKIVFTVLLPEDHSPENIDNEMLAFNLSCYYALKREKDNLLLCVKSALNLGKTPEQFLSDTDFEAYWEDKDFLHVLEP
ncbi:MAG: leucine-rich repeat domain-containing protein [bacterium]|nr:leucine-rich repeat domain-containing protein [bacterium]